MNVRKPNTSTETILAYKYKRNAIVSEGSYAFRDTVSLIEYFVPSLNKCFNKHGIFCAKKPQTDKSKDIGYNKAEPVTAVQLPKSFVDKMDSFQVKGDYDYTQWANQPENCSLFEKKPYNQIDVTVGNLIFIKSDKNFLSRLERNGNRVFKKAIISFILKNELPEKVSKEKLIELISALSREEQQSILSSVSIELKMEGKKLTKLREKYIEDEAPKALPIMAGAMFGLLTFLSAKIMLINSLGSMATSLITAVGGGVGAYLNEINKMNERWDKSEERAEWIFNAIELNYENEYRFVKCL